MQNPIKWANSLDRKGAAMVSLVATVVLIIFAAWFLLSGITWKEWFDQCGNAGTVAFWVAVIVIAWHYYRLLGAKKV